MQIFCLLVEFHYKECHSDVSFSLLAQEVFQQVNNYDAKNYLLKHLQC